MTLGCVTLAIKAHQNNSLPATAIILPVSISHPPIRHLPFITIFPNHTPLFHPTPAAIQPFSLHRLSPILCPHSHLLFSPSVLHLPNIFPPFTFLPSFLHLPSIPLPSSPSILHPPSVCPQRSIFLDHSSENRVWHMLSSSLRMFESKSNK